VSSDFTEFIFVSVLWLGQRRLSGAAWWLGPLSAGESERGEAQMLSFLPSPCAGEGVGTALFLFFVLCSMCLQPLNFSDFCKVRFSKASRMASKKSHGLAGILPLCLASLSGFFMKSETR